MALRERIIDRAADLFYTQGIKSITMSDIAQDLGISKRTLYEVFPNKEELLEITVMSQIKKADKEMEVFLSGSENVIDTLLRIYGKQLTEMHSTNKSLIFDLKKYYPAIYTKIQDKHKKDIETFIPLFQKGIDQGLIRSDVNINILLWLLGTQFKSLMENDWSRSSEYSIKEFVKMIILTFTRGIATAEGIKLINNTIVRLENEINSTDNNTIINK